MRRIAAQFAVAALPTLATAGVLSPQPSLDAAPWVDGIESAAVAVIARPAAAEPRQQRSEWRARLWWGSGAVNVGSGADLVSAASTTGALRPVVGMRAALSPTARGSNAGLGGGTAAVLQGDGLAAAARGTSADARARWALEVKSAENAAQQLRSGLFRVQLSSTSTLSLKPRSGGLSVTWRARF